jgi:ATP-binding cassette subfamily B protein
MSSHLAAFRVEVEMRRRAMERIVKLPLGFFDGNTIGKIRKVIDDNASITHSFLAHQLPDLAGSMLTPLVILVLIFVFDWRLGLASLAPVAFAMGIMGSMMGERGRQFMRQYMDSLEDMNTEAVEYVRGIPVVKVFQQTVHSFKNFYDSIIRYRKMVLGFTFMWERPMSFFIVLINAFVYVLIPVAILLVGNPGTLADVLLDLLFYILITPVIGTSIMRNANLNQMMGQAYEAVDRTEELTDVPPLPVSSDPKEITHHSIRFDNVSFSYPGTEQKAVDCVSF